MINGSFAFIYYIRYPQLCNTTYLLYCQVGGIILGMVGIYINSQLSDIEDRDELLELFEDIDNEVAAIKRQMAELWLFGTTDLTDEEYLSAYGLEY